MGQALRERWRSTPKAFFVRNRRRCPIWLFDGAPSHPPYHRARGTVTESSPDDAARSHRGTNPTVWCGDGQRADEAAYLGLDERVFGVSINGESRAYPLRITNPHEMVNDVLGGEPISLAW